MDLIFTNANREDQGIIKDYSLDYEMSNDKSKNTFEIQGVLGAVSLDINGYVHTDSEIGGRVDTVKVDTEKNVIYYSGRNYRGILGSKVIVPPNNEAYKVVSGDVNEIIGGLISDCGLTDLYMAQSACGITVRNYAFDRYIDLYSGIIKMLAKANAKLTLTWKAGKVLVGAVPIVDYSNEAELTSDLFDFVIEHKTATVNHLIALGQGQLTERQVVHRYIGADGKVSTTQYYNGTEEVAEAVSNTFAESYDELVAWAEEELAERSVSDSLEIKSYDLQADIGDKFTAFDLNTGLSVSQYVVDKIITYDGVTMQTKYEVGGKI